MDWLERGYVAWTIRLSDLLKSQLKESQELRDNFSGRLISRIFQLVSVFDRCVSMASIKVKKTFFFVYKKCFFYRLCYEANNLILPIGFKFQRLLKH